MEMRIKYLTEPPTKKSGFILILPTFFLNWDKESYSINIGWLWYDIEFEFNRK